MPKKTSKVLVAGLGNISRRDDALGLIATKRLKEHLSLHLTKKDLSQIVFIEAEISPIDYVQEISLSQLALGIDAIQLGKKPGTIHKLSEKDLRELLDGPSWDISSHDFSFLNAVDLGRRIDPHSRNPLQVIFYGIEPLDLGFGEGLSDPVAKSLPALVEAVSSFIQEILG